MTNKQGLWKEAVESKYESWREFRKQGGSIKQEKWFDKVMERKVGKEEIKSFFGRINGSGSRVGRKYQILYQNSDTLLHTTTKIEFVCLISNY